MIQNNLSVCDAVITSFTSFILLLHSLSNSMKVRILIIFSGYGRTKEKLQKEPKSWEYYGLRAHYVFLPQIHFYTNWSSALLPLHLPLDISKCQVNWAMWWAWKCWLSLNKAEKSFKFVKYDHDFISNWAIKLWNQIKNVKNRNSYGFVCWAARTLKIWKAYPLCVFYAFRGI